MKKNVQPGFTLVELLIVIALLGALAVGLLAALDPFEQFKKGADTGVRNTVSEIQRAVIGYYSIKNEMPWVSNTTTTFNGLLANDPQFTHLIATSLINVGELKTDFIALAANQLKQIYITGTLSDVAVCFQPTSKAFRGDPNTRYDNLGTSVAGCPNPDPTVTTCFWCVK